MSEYTPLFLRLEQGRELTWQEGDANFKFLYDLAKYATTSGNAGTGGVAGTSGTSGLSGTSGTSGIGTNGTSGTSGLSGTSGTSGVAGLDGASGTSGTSGAKGEDGTSGTSGVGLPIGGTSGQILSKVDDTDFNFEWINAPQGSGTQGDAGTSGTSGTSGRALNFIGGWLPTDAYGKNDIVQYGTPISVYIAKQGVSIGEDNPSINPKWTIMVMSGTSGTSGNNSGNGGTSGTSGIDGISGTSGTSGDSGTSGTSGVSGTSGTSGSTGADGSDGITGVGQWTPVKTANITQSEGSKFYRTNSGSGLYDEGFYSLEKFETAFVSAKLGTQLSGVQFIGLSSDNSVQTDPSDMDYCIGTVDIGGTIKIYENNVLAYSHSARWTSSNDTVKITYDGISVKYYYNNTLLRTVARAVGLPLGLDAAIKTGGGGVGWENVTFGPYGKSGVDGAGSGGTRSIGLLSGSITAQTPALDTISTIDLAAGQYLRIEGVARFAYSSTLNNVRIYLTDTSDTNLTDEVYSSIAKTPASSNATSYDETTINNLLPVIFNNSIGTITSGSGEAYITIIYLSTTNQTIKLKAQHTQPGQNYAYNLIYSKY